MSGDRIILEGMHFYGYHGDNAEERRLGQPFQVDLEVEMDLDLAGKSDLLQDTVNYAQLYQDVKEVMEGRPRNLLEALTDSIANLVLNSYPVMNVRVLVRKTRPPIGGGLLTSVGVEIFRSRNQ